MRGVTWVGFWFSGRSTAKSKLPISRTGCGRRRTCGREEDGRGEARGVAVDGGPTTRRSRMCLTKGQARTRALCSASISSITACNRGTCEDRNLEDRAQRFNDRSRLPYRILEILILNVLNERGIPSDDELLVEILKRGYCTFKCNRDDKLGDSVRPIKLVERWAVAIAGGIKAVP